VGRVAVANLSAVTRAFWDNFLRSRIDPSAAAKLLYESFRIGDTKESADEGAQLILTGAKTATSSLLWEYEQLGKPLPRVGSLSILENGQGEPVCIVETVWLEVLPFEKIDANFAADYGEWGSTLPAWQENNWRYNSKLCEQLGRVPTLQMLLVCERFRVVYAR
jgi:uncharacterized protein YhfF